MTVLITICLLFFFLAFGMPIALALGVAGAIGLLMMGGPGLLFGVTQTTPYESVASFLMTTIPMFILMAEFMTASGVTKTMFYAAHKWLGHLPGGLGMATVFAGAGLAAVSGSSTASAATLASAAVPEMKRYGYQMPFALGTVSIAGTLAIMIPPSIILILYGILTETGVGDLLIAGIIPGLLTALGYIVTIYIWAKRRPEVAPRIPVRPSLTERLQSLKGIWPMMLLVILVIGSIYAGIVTPTEAGAVGSFLAFLIALSMRTLTVQKVFQALAHTVRSTAMILSIVIGAMIFGYFLTITQFTQNVILYVQTLEISRWVIFAFVVILYLILGFFLDQIAILILTLPITFPLVTSLGFDPVWFGIIVTKTVELGLVTPPVGMNVFVAAGAVGVKTTEAFRGVFWFVITELIILLILILLPGLSTWLPSKML